MYTIIKKRSVKFILAFSLWMGLLPLAHGCIGGDDWGRFILMNPDIIDNRAWWNFIRYYDVYYGEVYQTTDDEKKLAQEWKTKLKLKSSVESIMQYLFYPLPDSANLKESAKKELEKNSTFKTFIGFANDCADLSSNEYSWDIEEFNRDSVNLLRKNKFNQGWNLFNQQKDEFWKKKYAFQLLKLSYYLGDHIRFNKLYTGYFDTENRTTIDWWALHYKSMVLEEQGKVDSANYLHALVFSHSSSKMHESLRWYRFKNLNNQLSMCKTDVERGNLYLMAAIRDWDVSIENVELAYQFDPNNPLLLLALNREINKIEEHLYVKSYTLGDRTEYSVQDVTTPAVQITHLYSVVLGMETIEKIRPDYYHLLAAELAILTRNVDEAQRHLNKVSKKKPAIRFQRQVFETMLTCITENIAHPNGQDKLYTQIQELLELRKNVFESENILNSLFDYIGEAYINKNKPIHALLFNNFASNYFPGDGWGWFDVWYILDDFDSTEDLEELIALINKPDKTKLEEWIVRPLGSDLRYRELLGTVYARNMQFDRAQKIFNAIPENDWPAASNVYAFMDENPFVLSHTKVYGREYVTWNKSEMLDTLIAIEKVPNKGLREYRLLGNIWFNLTKFGNSWYLFNYYIDGNMDRCYSDNNNNWYVSKGGWNTTYRDMLNKSMGYYNKALGLTKNKEEQAEFTYMICWCYFLTDKMDEYCKWAGKYEGMKKTRFYQEEKCTITPLYDERKELERAWTSY